MHRQWVQLLVMVAAAALEVGGDAMIRAGLRGGGGFSIVLGFLVLGSYGLAINQLPLDFSKLLGSYVGFFAIVSVLFGRLFFGEVLAFSTKFGLAVVLVGSLIMQLGSNR